MCGIAGIFRVDGARVDPEPIERMLDAIRHRGPDGRGVWTNASCALGHVRLSVIDLTERAHQPMLTGDGRGVLAYNGEVYNFRDLRRDLEREGITFESTGDAEVVLQALHHWGPLDAVPRFNGMFALAYLDRRDGTLWLARDRLGIKSLSLVRANGALVFCSETKGLLAHPDVHGELDANRAALFAIYGRHEQSRPIFRGFETLMPGTIRRLQNGADETTQYAHALQDVDVARLQKKPDPARAVGELVAALQESVRIHMISDAPLATMCSGGVDSSLITAMAKRERADVEAYVADVGGAVSEAAQAQKVGAHLGVPMHVVSIDRAAFLELWVDATWHRDTPTMHPSDAPLLAVARRCRQDGIKVLLTGEGADEVFGGYRWYVRTYELWRKARLRSRLMVGPLRKIWRRRWQRWQAAAHSQVTARDVPQLQLRLSAALAPEIEERRWALQEMLASIEPPEDRAVLVHGMDDLYHHLGWILHRHDRIAMAASIEMRLPFLENRLIDMGLHFPRRLRVHRGEPKWALKRAAAGWLPKDVVYAYKKGFPVAFELYRGAAGLLDGGYVAELFGWTRAMTRRLLPQIGADGHLTYPFTSLEMWGRLYQRGESRAEVLEALQAAAHQARGA